MKNAIEHFKKLITCDQFLITGSFAFMQLGLMQKAKDLDIIIVNPSEESIQILEKLKVPHISDYPEDKKQYKVKFENITIDFFITHKKIDCIELANGFSIASLKGTVNAKLQYARLKDYMQLKNIAEIFYTEKSFQSFLQSEQKKLL